MVIVKDYYGARQGTEEETVTDFRFECKPLQNLGGNSALSF